MKPRYINSTPILSNEWEHMYKLVAVDLDETLLNDARHVPLRVRRAIELARAKGVYIVPSSGRSFAIMQYILDEIGTKDMKDEYAISCNGACITENAHNTIIDLQPPTPWDFCNKIWKHGIQLGNVGVHVYTLASIYTTKWREDDRNIFTLTGIPAIETREADLEFLRNTHIVKILYMNNDFAYLQQLAHDMRDLTCDVGVTFSSNCYIEFTPKGISKGAALKRLAHHLGIDMSETIAVGDSANDTEMIKAAGLGVCMANADDSMKTQADYVTQDNNNEGGVAEVIEKFILNA